MQNIDSQTLLLIIVGIAAFAVLLQAGVLIGILVALVKTSRMVRDKADEFRTSTIPVLHHSRELLETTHTLVSRLEPRFDSAADDLAAIARTAREQVGRLDLAATDLQERLHRHTDRLDNMATGVLDFVENTGAYITETINRPRRRVSSVVAAAKAFVKGYSAPVQGHTTRVEHEPAHEPIPPVPISEDKNIPA